MKPCKYCGAKPTTRMEAEKGKDNLYHQWFFVECANPACSKAPRTPKFSVAALAESRWNREQ